MMSLLTESYQGVLFDQIDSITINKTWKSSKNKTSKFHSCEEILQGSELTNIFTKKGYPYKECFGGFQTATDICQNCLVVTESGNESRLAKPLWVIPLDLV